MMLVRGNSILLPVALPGHRLMDVQCAGRVLHDRPAGRMTDRSMLPPVVIGHGGLGSAQDYEMSDDCVTDYQTNRQTEAGPHLLLGTGAWSPPEIMMEPSRPSQAVLW